MVTRSRSSISAVVLTCTMISLSCSRFGDADCITVGPSAGDATLSTVTVTATTEKTVRTHLDGLRPVWDVSDEISVFGHYGTNCKMTAIAVSGGSAQFSGEVETSGPYAAAYPYSSDNAWDGTNLTVSIPSVQKVSASNIDSRAMSMVAYSENLKSQISFRNIGALIKVTISEPGVRSITVYSNDAETPMSGSLEINPATGEVTSVKDGCSSVTLMPESDVFEAGTYYLIAAPGEKPDGITLSLTRSIDKRKGERVSENKMQLVRSEVTGIGSYGMSNIDWGYKIYSFLDFKEYAADKINWDEEGETVELKADIDMQNENWTPITDTYDGTFEGNGHRLYNILVRSSQTAHLGVFGKYTKDVQNLTFGSRDGITYDGNSIIENSYSADNTNWTYAAPITYPEGFVTNVTNFMAIKVTANATHKSRAGGISAFIERETVFENCVNYGNITVEANTGKDSNVNCGGILGGINENNVKVRHCRNYGTVITRNKYTKGIGGIVGLSYSASNYCGIEECENHGDVRLEYSATHNDFAAVGGIMGRTVAAVGNARFFIRRCTNYGHVHGECVHMQAVGGICGRGEGAEITDCVNEGEVEIDHSTQTSTRWQAAGGIMGAAILTAETSTITGCINRGKVHIHDTESSGHTAKPSSSTTFYGVCAAGIVGLANGLDELSGNKNYGDVSVENGFKGTSSYPSPAYAAGIIGRDFTKVGFMSGNMNCKDASISARTTNTASAKADVKVGGIAALLSLSTMETGTNHGTISGSKVESSGTVYCGTICGDNQGTIKLAYWDGTCNGAEASGANTVGNGSMPQTSAKAPDESTDKPDGEITDPGHENGEWDD